MIIQSRTRTQIRQSVLRAIGGFVGTATGGGDTTSLIDTTGLAGFGDDELNGRRVYMTKVAGVTATSQSWVSDFDGATSDATLNTAVSGTVAAGDEYEIYPNYFSQLDIHDALDLAIMEATKEGLQIKQTDGQMTIKDIYEYNWLANFVGLYKVEYVSALEELEIADCDTAWTAGTSVTATLDDEMAMEGTYAVKLEVAAGAAAGAVLGYLNLTSINLAEYDRVEFDMYSTIALTAGYIDFALDNSLYCVSPTESLDVPAMTANTWYRHSLTLANPQSDTGIQSIGLVNTTDVGACSLFIDNVRAVKSGSKIWKVLHPDNWSLVKGTTNYLKFHSLLMGTPTQIRLSGYQIPSLLTADSSTSEIDPDYLIHFAIGHLLLNHAKSNSLEVDKRQEKGQFHLAQAEITKRKFTVSPVSGTRWL